MSMSRVNSQRDPFLKRSPQQVSQHGTSSSLLAGVYTSGDIDLWTFDLYKYAHGLLVWWASIVPILSFLGLFVLEFGRGTRQTDGQTDRHRPSFHNAPSYTEVGGVEIFNVIFMYQQLLSGPFSHGMIHLCRIFSVHAFSVGACSKRQMQGLNIKHRVRSASRRCRRSTGFRASTDSLRRRRPLRAMLCYAAWTAHVCMSRHSDAENSR